MPYVNKYAILQFLFWFLFLCKYRLLLRYDLVNRIVCHARSRQNVIYYVGFLMVLALAVHYICMLDPIKLWK